jgi:DNA-binding transcriptional regulator YhcF (GntR family)
VDEEDVTASGGPQAPYLRIADVLRQEIHEGVLGVGERIPPQSELEGRFHVSRPTVQRALAELRRDGYIETQRGRPAEVLDWRAASSGRASRHASDEPEPAFAALDTHVAEAFTQPDVTIDSFSLTTETLNAVLAAPVRQIMGGDLNPASVRVRILLPSLDASLAIPRLVDDREDDWPLIRLRELAGGHVVALRSSFTALKDLRPDVAQSVEFRTVPVTPTQKLYLINRRTALFGLYRVMARPVEFRGRTRDIYDVLGVGATLFTHRADDADPESVGSRFVDEAQAWFDSLWSTISEPLVLSG